MVVWPVCKVICRHETIPLGRSVGGQPVAFVDATLGHPLELVVGSLPVETVDCVVASELREQVEATGIPQSRELFGGQDPVEAIEGAVACKLGEQVAST